MSRFKKHINEEKTQAEKYTEGLIQVYENCKPFLQEAKGNPIYSGRRSKTGRGDDRLFVGTIRKDRRPKDTPLKYHILLNKLFVEEFGWRARTESLFCTKQIRTARYFGTPYYIFPIGDFDYIWNANTTDLFDDIKRIKDEIRDMRRAIDRLRDIKERDGFIDKGIFKVIIGPELLVYQKYLDVSYKEAVEMSDVKIKEVFDKYFVNKIKKDVFKFYVKNRGLDKLSSKTEIMLRPKSGKYIALSTDFWGLESVQGLMRNWKDKKYIENLRQGI